jgi:hypothetical protein
MLELSSLAGWAAGALLAIAAVAFIRRAPAWPRQWRAGRTTPVLSIENASRLLLVALAVSAVAALLGIIGWLRG